MAWSWRFPAMTNAQMLCPLRWDPPYARRYTTHANKYFFGKNMVVIATRSISPSTPLSAPDLWYTVQGTGDVLTATLGNGPVGFFSRITVWKGSSCGAMTCVGAGAITTTRVAATRVLLRGKRNGTPCITFALTEPKIKVNSS